MTYQHDDGGREALHLVEQLSRNLAGIETMEAASGSKRPPFLVYVFWPAATIATAFAVGIFGAGMVATEILSARAWTEYVADVSRIRWGMALLMGGWAFGYVATRLLPPWQKSQLKVKYYEFAHDEPQTMTPVRREIVNVEAGRYVQTRLNWAINWRGHLARRVFDQQGNVVYLTVTRKLITGLYPNPTDNYPTALNDLERLGMIDEDKYWTEAGLAELEDNLFFGRTNPPIEFEDES